ncbi:MAG: helix-turn-helix domain-containing protein [Kiloniellales bacterium]
MHEEGRDTTMGAPSQAQDLAARIRALRESLGLSQASFAGRVGVDQSNVSRWERGAPPDDAHIVRLAELAGQHPAAFRYGRLPETDSGSPPPDLVSVVGYVGAGQEIFALDDHALGAGLEAVEAPEGVGRDTMVAVRVRGDSMHPLRDGWLLFYRRDQHGVPEACLNRLCIVKLADDGPILVKELHRGYRDGHFVLSSWNAPPLEDVRVDWAAPVLSIRP